MKIVIDILTPKQVLFFQKLSESLERRGHKVSRTTRRYREVQQLLKLRGMDATVVGEHGGKALAGKLKASVERIWKLVDVLESIKPDVSISFSSPEMARASYGLKIPHVAVNDSPHAEAVARLAIPLSAKLLTPKVIPKKAWTRYGIRRDSIVQYNALDPWVWLRDFKPNRRILKELGLEESKPILTFRTEESFASYLLGRVQDETVIMPILKRVLEESVDVQIVAVPRYEEQVNALRETFGNDVVVCESVVDGQSLLCYTSVFVGAGGTMSTEAALLGVPTISCYPGEPTLVERYLVRKGLVTRETDPKKVAGKILDTLANRNLARGKSTLKAQRLVKNFEDPIEVIVEEVEKFD